MTTDRAAPAAGVLDTGHGTGIDPVTLTGVVHDRRRFDDWLQTTDDPADAVVGALFDGHLEAAQRLIDQAWAGADERTRFRLRGLGADVLRERGEVAAAAAVYRALLDEHAGTPREAVLWQHLGKVHFAAGDFAAAHGCFARALDLRTAAGAPDDQVESSRLALRRTDEELASELHRLEESLWRAETRFDQANYEAVLHSEFFEFGRSGRVWTRAASIAAQGGPIPAQLPLPEFRVQHVADDVVLVTYVSIVHYDTGTEVANRSSLWQRVDGRWLLRFHQGTPTTR